MLLKKLIKYIIILLFLFILIIKIRVEYFKYQQKQIQPVMIKVSPGDILARPNCNWFPGSESCLFGGTTGHMGIVIEGGSFLSNDKQMGGIKIIEARLFAHNKPYYRNKIMNYSIAENFGLKFRGRRFLLKTHLDSTETKIILQKLSTFQNSSYYVFSEKSGNTVNCVSLIWRLYSEALAIDLDKNGGIMIYPNDIITHPLFDLPESRIRF